MNIIGLDVGGTKIEGVVFDGKKILRHKTIATPKNLEDYKSSITDLTTQLSKGLKIYGLGVGQPGILEPKTGEMGSTPNTPFLKKFNSPKFYKTLGFSRFRLDNDAHCFALAELFLGRGRRFNNFACLTLGTGIGGAVVIEKKLFRGANNAAGHIGHIWIDPAYRAETRYKVSRDSKDFPVLAKILGILCADIINFLDMEAIILGGSVSVVYGKQFLPGAISYAKAHVVKIPVFPKILVSNLKHAGALGAALLFKESR